MTDKERIKQLEAELQIYKENPASEFYRALVEGVKYVTEQIKSKKLDLDQDPFADSILRLAEKSDKIFKGLDMGLAVFSTEDSIDAKKEAKKDKHIGVAV